MSRGVKGSQRESTGVKGSQGESRGVKWSHGESRGINIPWSCELYQSMAGEYNSACQTTTPTIAMGSSRTLCRKRLSKGTRRECEIFYLFVSTIYKILQKSNLQSTKLWLKSTIYKVWMSVNESINYWAEYAAKNVFAFGQSVLTNGSIVDQ